MADTIPGRAPRVNGKVIDYRPLNLRISDFEAKDQDRCELVAAADKILGYVWLRMQAHDKSAAVCSAGPILFWIDRELGFQCAVSGWARCSGVEPGSP